MNEKDQITRDEIDGVAVLFPDTKTVHIVSVHGYEASILVGARIMQRARELAGAYPHFQGVGVEPVGYDPAEVFFDVWPDVDSYLAQYDGL